MSPLAGSFPDGNCGVQRVEIRELFFQDRCFPQRAALRPESCNFLFVTWRDVKGQVRSSGALVACRQASLLCCSVGQSLWQGEAGITQETDGFLHAGSSCGLVHNARISVLKTFP